MDPFLGLTDSLDSLKGLEAMSFRDSKDLTAFFTDSALVLMSEEEKLLFLSMTPIREKSEDLAIYKFQSSVFSGLKPLS